MSRNTKNSKTFLTRNVSETPYNSGFDELENSLTQICEINRLYDLAAGNVYKYTIKL